MTKSLRLQAEPIASAPSSGGRNLGGHAVSPRCSIEHRTDELTAARGWPGMGPEPAVSSSKGSNGRQWHLSPRQPTSHWSDMDAWWLVPFTAVLSRTSCCTYDVLAHTPFWGQTQGQHRDNVLPLQRHHITSFQLYFSSRNIM
jgi:hypothetical protein